MFLTLLSIFPAPPVVTATVGGNNPNQECLLPFNYSGRTFSGCTNLDNGGNFWCYVKVGAGTRQVPGMWGNCPTSTYISRIVCLRAVGQCLIKGAVYWIRRQNPALDYRL